MFWEKTQEKESKKVHKIKQISVYWRVNIFLFSALSLTKDAYLYGNIMFHLSTCIVP